MAWTIEALGTNVVQNGGNITLVEPSGAASGDLLIACIAHKSNVAFTKPSAEWTQVQYLSNGDIDATNGVASGGMWYCIRGASAPSYVWTCTAGDISMGQVISYRLSSGTPALDTSSILQAGSIVTAVVGTTITTADAGELLIAMVAHGDSSTTVTFDSVNNPGTASTTTVAVTTEPASNAWYERSDTGTTTGSDTALFIADAIMTTAGATGAHSATASVGSNQVVIVAAFKVAVSGLSKNIDGSGDITAVSESLTLTSLGRVSVFDSVAISEDLTTRLNPLVASVADQANVSENLSLSSLGRTEIYDTVNTSENLTLSSLGRVEVYDSANVSEYLAYLRLCPLDTDTHWVDALCNWNEISGDVKWKTPEVEAYDVVAVSESVTLSSLGRVEVIDSVSVSEDTSAAPRQHFASVSDQVNVSESLSLSSLGRTSVYDSVNVSESLSLSSLGRTSIADQVNVSESLTLSSLGRTSISDTVNVSESLVLSSLGRADISDQVSVSENLALSSLGRVSVADLVNVSEETIGAIPTIGTIDKEVYDDVSVSENLTLSSLGRISVADQVNVSENLSLTSLGRVSLADTVNISEDLTLRSLGRVSVADVVQVSESIILTSLGRTSVSDTVSVSENLSLSSLGRAEVSDQVSVSEDVVGAAQAEVFLSVSILDNVIVTDSLEGFEPFGAASINDQVIVSENLSTHQSLGIEIFDSVTVAEIVERQNALASEIYDTVNSSESLLLSSLAHLNLFDNVVVSDEIETSHLGIDCAVWDSVEVSERVIGDLPSIYGFENGLYMVIPIDNNIIYLKRL